MAGNAGREGRAQGCHQWGSPQLPCCAWSCSVLAGAGLATGSAGRQLVTCCLHLPLSVLAAVCLTTAQFEMVGACARDFHQ